MGNGEDLVWTGIMSYSFLGFILTVDVAIYHGSPWSVRVLIFLAFDGFFLGVIKPCAWQVDFELNRSQFLA